MYFIIQFCCRNNHKQVFRLPAFLLYAVYNTDFFFLRPFFQKVRIYDNKISFLMIQVIEINFLSLYLVIKNIKQLTGIPVLPK